MAALSAFKKSVDKIKKNHFLMEKINSNKNTDYLIYLNKCKTINHDRKKSVDIL